MDVAACGQTRLQQKSHSVVKEVCKVARKFGINHELDFESRVHIIRIFSNVIGEKFEIEKSAILKMKRRKFERSLGTEMPNGQIMRMVEKG